VYLKPRTRIDLILHVAPFEEDEGDSSSFLKTAKDKAKFSVLVDCIIDRVNKEVGYEANLAHISYEVKRFAEMGLSLALEGYSDKIFNFAAIFVDLTLSCAQDNGIESTLLRNSLEKQHRRFKNANADVDVRCTANRLLYLLPDR